MHHSFLTVKHFRCFLLFLFCSGLFASKSAKGQQGTAARHFEIDATNPGYNPASPWVLWYWMDASVSETGIRADLIAMKQQGIAGAYLVCIKGKPDSLMVDPPVVQLSPRWWSCIKYAFRVADSLDLKLGIHVGDGFATSGGPWITPALSMQRVVWSDTSISGTGTNIHIRLPRPKDIHENYYKDIAVYAFPSLNGAGNTTDNNRPVVTTNAQGQDGGKLIDPDNTENFSSKAACWIDYAFKKPFTCRTVEVRTKGITFQAKRLRIFISDNGKDYRFFTQLVPARSGWQDYTYPVHYTIPAVKSKYFRFVYDPAGTEPGSEDLDDAKWSPGLKLTGLKLGTAPQIPNFEGKSAAVWRISKRADAGLIPDSECIAADGLLNITSFMQPDGSLDWKAPPGKWTILRMGHSSTGVKNATAGGGQGLECDKLNPQAVKLQFDSWFGKITEKIGPRLAADVLKVFYMDSWECGSQNWSPVFRKAFIEKRGYDPLKYLPAMAGYPVASAGKSEDFLHDIRLTIADLLRENYFGTVSGLAHARGYKVAAECTAPIMVSDGLEPFDLVDYPMGEFWLRSPTHDKPNDILDAVSGGHIYGKSIIQAEAFTELRNKWDEYPGMLKTLQDHHYAIGINRLVFHVFGENPWLDQEPGMTLGGVGLYFQRNQTWWPMARGWMDYTRRCQSLLQQGTPVTDIAVFNGEEIPSRAVLPDRLISVLPGLFGKERIRQEEDRLANRGNPLQHIPEKVTSSAGITTAKDWIDPLRGYKYDAINRDALLRLASVENGRVVLSTGASYAVLVLPGLRKMDPNGDHMSVAVARKLLELVKAGATILIDRYPGFAEGLDIDSTKRDSLGGIIKELIGTASFYNTHKTSGFIRKLGKGRVLYGAYQKRDLSSIGIERDLVAKNMDGRFSKGIAWNHRQLGPHLLKDAATDKDIPKLAMSGATELYFVSNQLDTARHLKLRMRVGDKTPLLYSPVEGRYIPAINWNTDQTGTMVELELPAGGSVFVLLTQKKSGAGIAGKPAVDGNTETDKVMQAVAGRWSVAFDAGRGGPESPVIFDTLISWAYHPLDSVRHYSGMATYSIDFKWAEKAKSKPEWSINEDIWLELGEVKNIAGVRLNNIDCGIAWTAPYRVNITKAIKKGKNHLEIQVANTWSNRIVTDQKLPASQRYTWTTAPFNLEGRKLLPAGLLGPVRIIATEHHPAVR